MIMKSQRKKPKKVENVERVIDVEKLRRTPKMAKKKKVLIDLCFIIFLKK
jgi:hypothetical protein